MSMLQINVQLPQLETLVRDLGLAPGGPVQQDLVMNVARRITKYTPKRTYSSVEHAIAQGTEPRNGRIVVRGPHIKYLYFGKVMAGTPRKATAKDLKYTTVYNRLAGPFWVDRMMDAEEDQIIEDEKRFILRGGR